MKKKLFCTLIVTTVLMSGTPNQMFAQASNLKTVSSSDLEKLKQAIESNPDDLSAHTNYLKEIGFVGGGMKSEFNDQALVKQYTEWMKKFPNSAVVPYALGHGYISKESPNARPYLLKAVTIDPNFDKAYFDLWSDGQRWGEFEKANEYLQKAISAAPQNPDYAFYYLNGQQKNHQEYVKLSLDFVKKFSTSERAPQSLYWLSHREQNYAEKIRFYELLKNSFSINKSPWTSSGLSEYYEVLLTNEPEKSVALCEFALKNIDKDSRGKKGWEDNMVLSKQVVEINNLLSGGKSTEAEAIINTIAIPARYGDTRLFLLLTQSKIFDAVGKTDQAYKTLLQVFAKTPVEKIFPALTLYGTKLGKNVDVIKKEVKHIRDTASKMAPDFALQNYYTGNINKLSDLKDKVILLTYWFPGCGPCRAEFPYFENVVKKFKGRREFLYLGINIVPEQDEYVLPFMKSSGYSFIPLKDNDKWQKGALDNRSAAPVNFLIDGRSGKVVFSNFRTDESNQDMLEMMIGSMLEK